MRSLAHTRTPAHALAPALAHAQAHALALARAHALALAPAHALALARAHALALARRALVSPLARPARGGRVGVGGALLILVMLHAARAHADEYETSVHAQAVAGVAKLADPLGGAAATVRHGGGSARFTWAYHDWLAWEIEAYGTFAESVQRDRVDVDGRLRDFRRGGAALGIDGGPSLRLGVKYIPTFSAGIGPQLRVHRSVSSAESETGNDGGPTGGDTVIDLAARIGVGFDYRVNRRWIVGARASGRTSLGLGAGTWRSVEGMVFVAYYWYSRLFVIR